MITNGPRAAVVRQPDGTEVRAVPPSSTATDTTGAGDAFTGGFLVARALGLSLEEALSNGHDLAAKTLTSRGAQLDA